MDCSSRCYKNLGCKATPQPGTSDQSPPVSPCRTTITRNSGGTPDPSLSATPKMQERTESQPPTCTKNRAYYKANPPRPRPAPMAKTRKRILSRHLIASPARTPRNSNPLREPPRHPSAKMQERTESQPPTCTKNRAYYKANPPQSCPTPMAKTGKRTLSRHPIPSPARTPRNSNPLREAPRHPNAKMQEQTESQPPARTENRAYYKANPPPTAPPIPLTKTQE